jgi:YesN/AraC family two-component response regulator
MKSVSGHGAAVSMLLVEDELTALELLGIVLFRKFPKVPLFTASNGKEGLQIFKEHRSCIVITDINMPEMNGAELTQEIRRINAETKIIAITAGSLRTHLNPEAGKAMAIDHYIVKPINFTVLFAAIEECLDQIAKLSLGQVALP